MSSDYGIETRNCDLCPDDSWDQARREFAHIFDGDSSSWKPGIYENFRDQINAYGDRGAELRRQKEKRCFRFVADCGGDAISICRDCLLKIAKEIE